MERVKLHDEFSLSRIVHGFWRLLDWNMKPEELVLFVLQNVPVLGAPIIIFA